MGIYQKVSYPLYLPESDVGGMVSKLTTTDNPAKTKYLEKVGEGYNLIKLVWNHNGKYKHITIVTYKTSDGWHIMHSNTKTNSVAVLYWIDIGRGN
jgi:hypothetical protein